MSKTIQLQNIRKGCRDKNLILSGDTIQLDHDKYRLSNMDLTRLLMFCEDNIRRIEQRPKIKQ